jgi:SAM-dependent methyltransferase
MKVFNKRPKYGQITQPVETVKGDYFSGEKLYGDDFSFEQIQEWYRQESEAYAQMYGMKAQMETYNHHVHKMYGYKYLRKISVFDKVLGLGSSWGYEFLPVIDKIKELHIIESSLQTRSEKLGTLIPVYHTPNVSGVINFPDNSFDLINVFSTLHHIPNVTFVLKELFRVLKPGGHLLLKEPIISMGDWRKKRDGLTVNERGIPEKILDKTIKDSNMYIVKKHYLLCMTSFFSRITNNHSFFRSKYYFIIDKYLSKLFVFNIIYHPITRFKRIAPQNVFYVLKKQA